MNLKQRRKKAKEYDALLNKWVNSYTPRLYKVFRDQYKETIAVLNEKGIKAAINALNLSIFNPEIGKLIGEMYRKFVLSYATSSYNELIRLAAIKVKRKDDTGAFGFSEPWNQSITEYLNQYLLSRAVLQYNDGTKQEILKVLLEGQAQGWGIDRIIQELNSIEERSITEFRARRIVRTELSIAANHADNMVQDSVPFEVEKVWISTHDNRTRDSHNKMDGVQVDGDVSFHVPRMRGKVQIGVDLMNGPGDPAGSAENVINCRCTRGLEPKRDKTGRLIPKQQKIKPL